MTGLGLQSGVVALAGVSSLDIFVQTFAKALALGSLYALLALGFVLIYKTTQTLNFSQGALALTGTWFMSMVFIDWDIPGRFMGGPTWFHWFTALFVAVAVTAGLGMVIERLAIRPMIGEPLFSMAMPRLAVTAIATSRAMNQWNHVGPPMNRPGMSQSMNTMDMNQVPVRARAPWEKLRVWVVL